MYRYSRSPWRPRHFRKGWIYGTRGNSDCARAEVGCDRTTIQVGEGAVSVPPPVTLPEPTVRAKMFSEDRNIKVAPADSDIGIAKSVGVARNQRPSINDGSTLVIAGGESDCPITTSLIPGWSWDSHSHRPAITKVEPSLMEGRWLQRQRSWQYQCHCQRGNLNVAVSENISA